jgi:NAD(P)-dependent dehydrogenase (short-subunit alcohol dehydrogenase family)
MRMGRIAGGASAAGAANISGSKDNEQSKQQAIRRQCGTGDRRFGGRLDIAFNNAGMTGNTSTPIFDASEQDFEQVIDVNVRGVWYCTKYEFAEMVKCGGGSIVICGSTASLRGGVGRASAYYTSKHAVMGLVKQAAIDGATRNIRVNAVLPGMCMTELVVTGFANDPGKLKELADRIPMKRSAAPEEIANPVLFLASSEASYITGVGLSVDGGATI